LNKVTSKINLSRKKLSGRFYKEKMDLLYDFRKKIMDLLGDFI